MDEQNYYTDKWEPPYRVMDIAQYILKKSMQDKHPVTYLQLQRILYYVYRENIKNGRKLFKEQFEWCKFGPIIQCIYDTFVGSEAAPIIYLSKKCPVIAYRDKQIIDRVIENARDKNFQDIAKDLHEENVWYQNRIMEILNYGKDEPESNIHNVTKDMTRFTADECIQMVYKTLADETFISKINDSLCGASEILYFFSVFVNCLEQYLKDTDKDKKEQ